MVKNLEQMKMLKNADGKRILEKNRLDYSKEIINVLKSNPQIISDITDYLEVNENYFFELLSGEKKGNISFYDEALKSVYDLVNKDVEKSTNTRTK